MSFNFGKQHQKHRQRNDSKRRCHPERSVSEVEGASRQGFLCGIDSAKILRLRGFAAPLRMTDLFACAGRGYVSVLQWLLLQNLVGIAGDVLENVFNPAVQDSAQVIERCGCDGFVVAQLVYK